jgi:integrase
MGYIQARKRVRGMTYTVYARDDEGNRVSLGTFDSKSEAEKCLHNAPDISQASTGGLTPLMTVEEFFLDHFVPSLSTTTRVRYRSVLKNHVLPEIGDKKLRDVSRTELSKLIDSLELQEGTIRLVKAVLSSGFNYLIDQNVLTSSPATRLKVRKQSKIKDDDVLEPKQMKAILAELSSLYGEVPRLFALFLIETGCRFGETAEIRPKDINWSTGVVHIRRSVAYTGREGNPDDSGAYWVKTPKSGRARITTLSQEVLQELSDHVDTHHIGDNDLLFPGRLFGQPESVPWVEIDLTEELIQSLGYTDPSADTDGYVYRHGTYSAYVHAKCRCQYCGQARRNYRRKQQKAQATGRVPNLTGHLSSSTWTSMWKQAASSCVNGWVPRTHDIRHAHASWLLDAGMDLHSVKQRLGHSSITTTEAYLHRIKSKKNAGADIVRSALG